MNTSRVAITGNTYPVKDQLKNLGAKWDADRKTWMVAADKAAQAKQLVSGAPAQASTPGKCVKCGGKVKAPYHLCYTCKFGHSSHGSSTSGMVRCRQCGERTPEGDDWCTRCGSADYE